MRPAPALLLPLAVTALLAGDAWPAAAQTPAPLPVQAPPGGVVIIIVTGGQPAPQPVAPSATLVPSSALGLSLLGAESARSADLDKRLEMMEKRMRVLEDRIEKLLTIITAKPEAAPPPQKIPPPPDKN